MGIALQVQKVSGEQADFPVVELEEALAVFDSMPWEEEIEAWGLVKDEEREDFRPLFQLIDDSENSLRITAYCPDLVALAYSYPMSGCGTLAGPDVEFGYVGTDQFPRKHMRELLTRFFTGDTDRVLALLQRYPVVADTQEAP